jgi:hypothetical protein
MAAALSEGNGYESRVDAAGACATHGRKPQRANNHTMGHQFVKADCKRFSPAKAVTSSQ